MDEIYTKDYDGWTNKKKRLDARVLPMDFFFLEREVWWAAIGVNIGREEDGKLRPKTRNPPIGALGDFVPLLYCASILSKIISLSSCPCS
jgi:hypothetical protein